MANVLENTAARNHFVGNGPDVRRTGGTTLGGRQTLTMSTSIKRHGRFWTEEDDNLLRAMAAAGKSLTLMTVKLGRPMRTIKARAQDLHIPLPGEDKTTKRWMG